MTQEDIAYSIATGTFLTQSFSKEDYLEIDLLEYVIEAYEYIGNMEEKIEQLAQDILNALKSQINKDVSILNPPTFSDEPISDEVWEKRYAPISLQNDDSYSFIDDFNEAVKEASKLNPQNPQFHVWTRVDADSGDELILTNGFRICNRIDYCVAKVPWGKEVEASDYIEVHFDVEEV